MMEYLYLIWYVLALTIIGGILWHTLKQRGLFSRDEVREYEDTMKNIYGKRGYLIIKVIGTIFLVLFWIYMLGKCSQDYLKI